MILPSIVGLEYYKDDIIPRTTLKDMFGEDYSKLVRYVYKNKLVTKFAVRKNGTLFLYPIDGCPHICVERYLIADRSGR